MKGKLLGIFGLLVVLCTVMAFATADPWWNLSTSRFLQPGNIQNLLSRTAMYGVLGIGVAFVIITGGIDLSIGSIVCLAGVLLSLFLQVQYQADQVLTVSAVSKAEQSITLTSATERLRPGDHVRHSGGRAAPRLFEIAGISNVDGQTILTTKEQPRRDEGAKDGAGEVFVALPVVELLRPPDGDDQPNATVTFASEVTAVPGDQLTLTNAASRVSVQEIVSVDTTGGVTRIQLKNDPGTTFDNDAFGYVLRRRQRMSIPAALSLVMFICMIHGLIHGLLVTRARLQPFVVTLCGLMYYRGLSRWLTGDEPAGFGEFQTTLGAVATGRLTIVSNADGPVFGIPYPFFFLLAIGACAAIFMSCTIFGRYLLALGRNEEAARFSGINTKRMTLSAYVVCTTLAGLGGMLFALNAGSVSPSSFGNFFELYAIAAAVLGGCSLRGGEGSILGVIIGTAVMQVLNNLIILLKIPGSLEYTIIGSVIMAGVFTDEMVKRYAARRRLKLSAANAETAAQPGKPATPSTAESDA
jgi:ribose transport system permease protein